MKTTQNILNQLEEVLMQNISDNTFGITEFCNALDISRTQLHRKVTESTGMSTSLYIRSLRLEIAKDLLETTDMLVYEVAQEVGFRDVTYFSTSFSKEFGYPPKDLKG